MQTLTIQTDKDKTPQVEAFLSHFCDENRIGNYLATITVAVLQAINNAVTYGNGGDPSKRVTIGCGYCTGGVFFEVGDECHAFDYAAANTDDLSSDIGTAMFVISNLADRIAFANGGSTVRMEFLIRGIDRRVVADRQRVLQKFFMPRAVSV